MHLTQKVTGLRTCWTYDECVTLTRNDLGRYKLRKVCSTSAETKSLTIFVWFLERELNEWNHANVIVTLILSKTMEEYRSHVHITHLPRASTSNPAHLLSSSVTFMSKS